MADTQEDETALQVVPASVVAPQQEVIEDDEDDSEGSDVEEDDEEVRLGFVEEADLELLSLNEGFPNKVGGKPVWLDVEHLIPSTELICKKCGKQMVFLMQIYAPIDGNPGAFHRTLFVFCCKNGSCKRYAPLCEVCGCSGPKRCSQCQYITYCSREHQAEDWRVGHSEVCKKIQAWKKERGLEQTKELPKDVALPKFKKYASKFLFKEFEVITDVEPAPDADKDLPEDEKKNLMSKYDDYLKNWTKKDNAELDDEFKAGHSDKQFARFSVRIARDPEQVLRYCRSETSHPFWVSTKGQCTAGDVTNCQLCGGPRKFEFQILPQLLYFLGVEENKEIAPLDWGTLAIYTCWKSCEIPKEQGWAEELLWNQDMAS